MGREQIKTVLKTHNKSTKISSCRSVMVQIKVNHKSKCNMGVLI